MNLILDTHVVIWWYEKPELLSATTIGLIEDKNNSVFVSAVVLWEVAIKSSLRKLRVLLIFLV